MNIHDPNVTLPKVTTGALPASRKVYSRPEAAPDLRVPLREIALDASSGEPPLPVYDTTGPYTDPDVTIDVEKGLPRARIEWVKERGGIEEYQGRDIKPVDNGNVSGKHLARNFPNTPKPWRAVSTGGASFSSPPPQAGARPPPPPSPTLPRKRGRERVPCRQTNTPSPSSNGRARASSPGK
jgi:phosphomethylpyrimidine synthase